VGHAQELLEHSDCFHGRYSDFRPLAASQSVSALYYQFTSTLRGGHLLEAISNSIAIDELGESHPRSAILHLQSASVSGLLLPQWLRRSRQRDSWQSSFVFISMTIVT
jgi:hypothetical protein